jgi:hypothetical protein
MCDQTDKKKARVTFIKPDLDDFQAFLDSVNAFCRAMGIEVSPQSDRDIAMSWNKDHPDNPVPLPDVPDAPAPGEEKPAEK